MDIGFDEIDAVNVVASGNGKIMFFYQAKEMKNICESYSNHMILLDTTYKITKYTLPMLFIVVQTNVHFQLCCGKYLQEESTKMISKALKISKEWNSMISPKYTFVDFYKHEIISLGIVFERVKVFLCDFRTKQAWHR